MDDAIKMNLYTLFHSSSAVEQSAVNRSVAGSNPACGAIWRRSSAGESVRFIPVRSWVRSPPPLLIRTLSSVGQSYRLITDWSQVRVLQGPLAYWRNTQVWLKGSVLKTDRGVKTRGGSNPSSSSIHIF